jgi:alpha-glucoside transport system substrate-binding protein
MCAAGIAGAGLVLSVAACSSDSSSSSDGSGDSGGGASVSSIDCSAYDSFGDLKGKTVKVYTSIVDPEAQTQKDSYKPFEDCTGVTVDYEGSREFEAQLLVRIKAGNAPDIAYLPQPGLLATIVRDTGKIVPAPTEVAANVEENWEASWKDYGTVDGEFYAAPLGANVKSYVWYSPQAFMDAGYEVPTTWADMLTLTDQMAKDNPDGDIKPWCAGFESGDATGWPGTDWIEDAMLRTGGPDVYDQWYKHEIPFNDPKVATAFDAVGDILKNTDSVNGGFGDVSSIATTPWTDAGTPILDGTCLMMRAANFYQTQWPSGTTVGKDGEVFAFYLPTDQTDIKPVEVGGEFVAAFNDRPEVQAFQTYLSSADWANAKALATPDGGWVSANKGLKAENLSTEFDKLSLEILADPKTVSRFDASDLMPGEVGAGTFWTGMVNWVTGTDTASVLDTIEASWPKS